MKLTIELLDEKHKTLIDNFTCVENDELLVKFDSKTRKRIKKHSKEMDDFLKFEALVEQNLKANKTHLFIDDSEECRKLMGFVSLCTDSIHLDIEELQSCGVPYQSVPALKIARLATDVNYQCRGIGKTMIDFSVYVACNIRKFVGVKFITLDCYKHRLSYYQNQNFILNSIQPIELPYDTPYSLRLDIDEYLKSTTSS